MKKAKWMWQYGEYELYHNMLLHMRREEFGAAFPPFWRVPSPSPYLTLHCDFENETASTLRLSVRGIGYAMLDGVRSPANTLVSIVPGKHHIKVTVMNDKTLPAAYVESDVCPSGDGWYSLTQPAYLGAPMVRTPAGSSDAYSSVEDDPSVFPFVYKEITATQETVNGGVLYDFGKERFAKLTLTFDANTDATVFYGESREEALAEKEALLWETLSGKASYSLVPRAFRYVFIRSQMPVFLRAEEECTKETREAAFHCSDALLNDVYRACADTFRLNSREFFLDGIKRDRWVWSGDAFQSYIIDRYFRRDGDIMRRTILSLGGDGVFTEHINTITDYSLYWLISVMEYHKHYGDEGFLTHVYPKMKSLLSFCEGRCNADGFIEGAEGDWVFVDWSDYDKTGAICAEQILLMQAYKAIAYVAEKSGENATPYLAKKDELSQKIRTYYWCDEKGAFIDSYASGKKNVTRHANILAVLFDYATEEEKASILKNVLLNDAITPITTPYFAFYEIDALARLGAASDLSDRIRAYWGAMLARGATTIWEEFDPTVTGVAQYAMYANAFGKSLCHAWGAGPLYLFGRYYLGVESTESGFTVTPDTHGLTYISGELPLKEGFVRVYADGECVRVYAECGGGILRLNGKEYPIPSQTELTVQIEHQA